MVESKALVENFQNQTSYILLYDNNEIDNEEHFLLGFVEPFNIDNSSHHQLFIVCVDGAQAIQVKHTSLSL